MNDFKDTCKYAKPNNTITLLTVIRNLKTCVSDPSIQHTRRMAFDNIFWVNTVKKNYCDQIMFNWQRHDDTSNLCKA